jgi:ferric-dicitrate binding protein FerR (iron transport regulator)
VCCSKCFDVEEDQVGLAAWHAASPSHLAQFAPIEEIYRFTAQEMGEKEGAYGEAHAPVHLPGRAIGADTLSLARHQHPNTTQ